MIRSMRRPGGSVSIGGRGGWRVRADGGAGRRWAVALTVVAAAVGGGVVEVGAQESRQNVRERIGYGEAQRRMGRAMPSGLGVAFAHVEGSPGKYRPNLEGPNFETVAFSLRSGPSEPSPHATAVGRVIYGSRGLAPGVEVVHCMTTQDFLGEGYLNAASTGPPGGDDGSPFPPRVMTHSWIADPPADQAARILRRVDYQIDTRDVVMCVGVNNGRDRPVPALLGSAHNVIAVGTTNGQSSGGFTRIEVPGRSKPDLVAPDGMTSFTTPVVSACAALLLEQADRLVEAGHPMANRSETIKAALLGGAVKREAWQVQPGRVLDEHLGAGEVNLDRSLRILDSAPAVPGQPLRQLFGWSTVQLPGAQGETGQASVVGYELELPVDVGPVTITAVWNRRIDGRLANVIRREDQQRFTVWLDAPRLANIDLRLWKLDEAGRVVAGESAIDGDTPPAADAEAGDQDNVKTEVAAADANREPETAAGQAAADPADTETEAGPAPLAASLSTIDNVELIHLPSLAAGRYRIELSRDPALDPLPEAWDVALAWTIDRASTGSPAAEAEPSNSSESKTDTGADDPSDADPPTDIDTPDPAAIP